MSPTAETTPAIRSLLADDPAGRRISEFDYRNHGPGLSGTAAQGTLPSANTGQTITLTGSGFVSGDTVVFETVDNNGRMALIGAVAPATVAADGTSMTVVVPANAATGMVRLARELVGRYLQIVPTINGR
jgi:hypothetical protein